MGRHVHSNISKTDHGRCRLIGIEKCGTTQLSAHACQKFRNTKGLREIIVRARVKCFDLFFLTLSGRQNYDRYIRPGSELPDESLSVTVGKTEIDNDQLRPAGGRINPRLLSRLRLSGSHAFLFERDTDQSDEYPPHPRRLRSEACSCSIFFLDSRRRPQRHANLKSSSGRLCRLSPDRPSVRSNDASAEGKAEPYPRD